MKRREHQRRRSGNGKRTRETKRERKVNRRKKESGGVLARVRARQIKKKRDTGSEIT